MNHSFSLLLLTILSALSLSSCVDPNYYNSGNTGTSYSTSATFTTLPHGYRTIYVSGSPYYYCGSRWYRRSGSHYVTCARPYGYYGTVGRSHQYHGISHLPYGCRTTYVGGHRYYTHGNTWYRKSGSRYVTCSKPSNYHSGRHKSHQRIDKHKNQYKKSDHKKHSYKHHKKKASKSPSNGTTHTTVHVKTNQPKQKANKQSSQKTLCKEKDTPRNSKSYAISRTKPHSRSSQTMNAKSNPQQTRLGTRLKNRLSGVARQEKD